MKRDIKSVDIPADSTALIIKLLWFKYEAK